MELKNLNHIYCSTQYTNAFFIALALFEYAEDFEMCFRDYTKALEIMQELVDPDHRGIAELYP